MRTSECPFLAPESLLGCGISLGGPLFQSELSAEVPARPQSPPESLKCLSRWPNATMTLVPPHVSLSCPQMFSSPSGPSFIIEARKKFNLGHPPAQSGNCFCLFALTKPSSSADLFCLPFWQHFPLLNFRCNLLFPPLLLLFFRLSFTHMKTPSRLLSLLRLPY